MRTVRLLIGFQGTRYEGWQSQKKNNTLQELFEKYLKTIFKEKISLLSSSRTDSGVHARGMVAHFKITSPLPDAKIKAALNFYLPPDVLVYSAKTMPAAFHARYDARSKIYRYQIWNQKTRPLFEAPYVLWYPHPLNTILMRKAARSFIGRHDFSAFKDHGDEKKSYVRTIRRLHVVKKGGLLTIEIEADGFLRHMVRIIVGTLIEVGKKKLPPQQILPILRSKDRKLAGPTAKALGLTLIKVKYSS